MNRKKLKRQLMSRPVTLTQKKVNTMKDQAVNQAIQVTNLLPLLVLHDEFGFGKKRLERYLGAFNKQLEMYNEGRFDLIDVIETLNDETKLNYEVTG